MPESAGAFHERLDEVRVRLRRARAGLVVGALSGAAILVALVAVVGSDASEPGGSSLWVLLALVPLVLFGAAIGHLIGGGRLDTRVGSEVGFDIGADRIKRAVRGEDVDLSPEQQRRAARYAAMQVLVAPATALRWGLLVGGLVLGQGARLLEAATRVDGTTTGLTFAGIALVSALLLAGLLPSRVRAVQRARTYSTQHPWDARETG